MGPGSKGGGQGFSKGKGGGTGGKQGGKLGGRGERGALFSKNVRFLTFELFVEFGRRELPKLRPRRAAPSLQLSG